MSQNQSPEAIKVKLNELYEDAKNKGTITRDEVANQLMEMEIDADQMNKIYETLESMGVDVVAEFDPVPPEELIEPEQIDLSVPEGISIDDPVRMYLKEIGKVPLLDRRGGNRASPSAWKRATRRPSKSSPRPTCAWWSPSPSGMWAAACCFWT